MDLYGLGKTVKLPGAPSNKAKRTLLTDAIRPNVGKTAGFQDVRPYQHLVGPEAGSGE